MELKLHQTCSACPEQYDVLSGERVVGYMRLRHGHFYAEAYTDVDGFREETTVYTASPQGDGMFEPDERQEHLDRAMAAIRAKLADVAEMPEFLSIKKHELVQLIAVARLKLEQGDTPFRGTIEGLCDDLDAAVNAYGEETWVAPKTLAHFIMLCS